jgi:hydroxyacylglutathione hydrolase
MESADAPSDGGPRVPESRKLREEPPEVVQRRRRQPASETSEERRELREIAPVRRDGALGEVSLVREMRAERLDQARVITGKLVGNGHAVDPLVPPAVGPFKPPSARPPSALLRSDLVTLDVLTTAGLGDNSYLVSSGTEAAAIDPQRDVTRFIEAARTRGARIRYVVETHVHNDYVSGAAELRAATGAEVAGPARAGYAFPHRSLHDGDELGVGDLTLVAISTPGHTPEHTCYLLREAGASEPSALFSGGSLTVGSAGRTDLLGYELTEELTHQQFRSMRRLAELRDGVILLPTHGAGSFCTTAPPGKQRTSSIGVERLTNPALTVVDEALFVREQLDGLAAYPDYYAHVAPINRAGPVVYGDVPIPPAMSADDVDALLRRGAWLVDARDGASFAQAHISSSLNVPLADSFASYVGWLVPFGDEIVLLIPSHEALVETATQLFRIGYERVSGHLEGGVGAWQGSGRDVSSYPALSVQQLVEELARGEAGLVVDVRQRSEWDAGHLEGSRHEFVGDVPDRLNTFDRDVVTTVVCASGYRSAMAASVLDRAGIPVRLVARGGVPRALRTLARSS